MAKLSTISSIGAASVVTPAAGVGVGQLYRIYGSSSTGELLSYAPAELGSEDEQITEQFQFKNWGCMKRLFPNIDIQHQDVNLQDYVDEEPFLTIPDVSKGYITCGMVEARPATLDPAHHKNRVYAKSEFVVKGEKHGGVMGTGMHTLPKKKGDAYVDSVYLVHKLITFIKNGEKGKIDKGYGWEDYVDASKFNSDSSVYVQVHDENDAVIPDTHRFGRNCKSVISYGGNYGCRSYLDDKDFPRKSWAGVGEFVDQKDIPDSDYAFKEDKENGGVNPNKYVSSVRLSHAMGSDGNNDIGTSKSEFGYYIEGPELKIDKNTDLATVEAPLRQTLGRNIRYVYVKDKGGHYMSKTKDMATALIRGGAPFELRREDFPYIRGTKISDRCDQLKNDGPDLKAPFAEDLISLCYLPK